MRQQDRLLVMTLMAAITVAASAQPTTPSKPTAPPKPESAANEPAGDWVNWDDVEKLYSPEAIEKISDPDARAAVQAIADENRASRSDALADFKQGAGLGLSVAIGSDKESIDSAIIVDGKVLVTKRAKDHPRATLEVHQLFTTNVFTQSGRKAAREQLRACGIDPVNCPMFGIGPFAAIQFGGENAVSSLGAGIMIGLRNDPRRDSSFNIGLGLVVDSAIKRLASGFDEGGAPPDGETEVRFVEESARRIILTFSFGF